MAFSRDAISSSRQRASTCALDLVERSIPRRRDAGHFVPDVAAVGLDRIVVDADIGTERGVDHFGGVGEIAHRLAFRIAAGAIDGVIGDDRQLHFLRRLLQRAAAGARVLDLVVHARHVRLAALARDVLADLRRQFGERFGFLRFDLGARSRCTAPKRPCTGALTSPSLSAKAASATAGSMSSDFVTVPRSRS